MKKELRIGILLQISYLIMNRFLNIPDLLLGLLFGIGLILIISGMLPEKTYEKMKRLKNGLPLNRMN